MSTFITLNPIDPQTDARVTVRLCASQDAAHTGAAGQVWWPAIVTQPVIQARLFDGDFTSGVDAGSASIEVRLDVLRASGQFPRVERYDWAGATATIQRLVGGSLADLAVMKVDSFAVEDMQLGLRLSASAELFDVDVLSATYAGTTGLEGGADIKGRVKPWVFGRALNVEPVFIDQIDNVFQVSGYGPVQAISAVYERGASFGASQGNYANLAALIAAPLQGGQWATCHAQGLFRLGGPPAGVITCDVDGDNTGGFLRRTGAILTEIANRRGLSANINATSLANLDTAVPRNVNIVISEQTSFMDLVQRMVAPCNAVPGIGADGRLLVSRVVFGSEQFTLDAQGREMPPVLGMARQNTSAPYKRIQIGAARSWRVHSFDEIAFFSDLIDRGLYSGATVYREGDIVASADKSRWLYINTTPGSGNAPPTWPTTSNTYWSNLEPPLAPSAIGLEAGSTRNVARGTYDAGTTYLRGDEVIFSGSTYRLIVESSTGNAPPDVLRWALVAQAGAGPAGADGLPGISVLVSNEAHVVATAQDGSGGNYTGAGGTMRLLRGDTVLTPTFSIAAQTPASPSWISINASTGVYTVTDPGVDLATATIRANWAGVNYDRTYTLAKSKAGANGAAGAAGLNNATVFIYRRSATVPTLPSTAATYTFATGAISGLNNSWMATIPAGTDPLYVAVATASSASATDTIASNEWSSPVVLAQNGASGANGADGAAGLNSAAVFIYQRAAAAPAAPTTTATYTFATGGLTGLNNGWSATIPANNGQPLWVRQASASSTGATDTIATGEWSAAQQFAVDGTPGGDGSSSAVVFIYARAATAPAAPTGATTYTFATGVLSGTLGNGWTQSIPAANGQPLWVRTAVAFGTTTDTIAAAEWSGATQLAQDGAQGPAGLNSASVFLYRRSGSVPPVPSTTATYTFATGALTGQNNSWTQTVPSGTDPIYVITASAASTGATDTIASGEWSSPSILAQNGDQGPAGPTLRLLANSQAFTFTDGTANPTSQTITLTAQLSGVSGTATFTATPTVTLTGTGNTRTLTAANFGANRQVTIEATLGGITDRITIVRLDRDAFGGNANRVPFSRFEGDRGWKMGFNPNGLAFNEIYGVFAGYPFFATQFTATAANQIGVIAQQPAPALAFTAQPGERLSVQARVTAQNVNNWTLNLWWVRSDGSRTQASVASGVTDVNTTDGVQQAFLTAPVDSPPVVGAYLDLAGSSAAAGIMQLAFRDPMVTSAAPGQTVHPNFTPGPNAVDGALPNNLITIDSGIINGIGTAGVNVDNRGVVLSGLLSARPASGTFLGQTYAATDTREFFRWDGFNWQTASDVTATAQITTSQPTPFQVQANSEGVTTTDLSTQTRSIMLYRGGVLQTSGVTVGTLVPSTGITVASAVVSGGIVTVTLATANASGSVTVPVIFAGVTYNVTIPVTRTIAAPVAGGNGSQSFFDQSWSNITSTTYTQVTDAGATVLSTSGGQLAFSYSAQYNGGNAQCKAQYSANGTTWFDVAGSEVTGSIPITAPGEEEPGSISRSQVIQSGLDASTLYHVRLVARRTGGTGVLSWLAPTFTARQP